MRSEEEANRTIERYADTVRRICMVHLKNYADTEHSELLDAVLSLPEKYKNVVYLYYYEEYSAAEISRILKKNVNTVYTLLTRARHLLKQELEGWTDNASAGSYPWKATTTTEIPLQTPLTSNIWITWMPWTAS